MKLATWISVLVLGPGALAIFVWFLVDLVRTFRSPADTPGEEPSSGESD